MARHAQAQSQLDLFTSPATPPPVVGATAVSPAMVALARRLPRQIYLGTSSWTFPGWQGLVYDRVASASVLARHGLSAYARHPLLRTVCVDRTFYAPLPAADYAIYAASVPDDFRFVVKAHAWCTQPTRVTQAMLAGVATHLTSTFCIPAMLPSTSWSRASLDWAPKPALSCFNSHPLMCEPWVDHSTLPHVYTLFSRPCRVGRCTRSSCAITSSYLRPIARC